MQPTPSVNIIRMVGLYFLLIRKKLKNPSSRLYLVHHKTLLDLKTESPLFPREAVETPPNRPTTNYEHFRSIGLLQPGRTQIGAPTGAARSESHH